jgi:hypothetical protein
MEEDGSYGHKRGAHMRRYEEGAMQSPKHGEHYGPNLGARPMMERHRSMIGDDRNAPANLPQRVIDEYWPKSTYNNMGYVDDLFYGVNKQLNRDNDDFGRVMSPKKY